MIYGSIAAVMTKNVLAQTQTQSLPTCTNPTGNNLPCMIVISTLPAPTNAVQCQETTGQTLPCSYATQTLSNGQEIVLITVYAPANFVFSGPVTVIIHETEKIIHEAEGAGGGAKGPVSSCKGIQGVHGCIIFMSGGPGQPPIAIYLTPLPGGLHTPGFEAGWFAGNTGSDPYNPYPVGSKNWLAYNLGFEQGDKASTPYTNCEHYDTCTDPKYDPTHDPHYKPQQEPSPCLAGNVDTFSPAFALKPLQSICPPIGVASLQCGTGAVVPGQVTSQPHTAVYLQALNSGSPNPYKPGTIDYQHYQAGLLARQQNGGTGPGIVTPGSTTSNNNNNPSTTKKCPDGSTIPIKDKCPTSKQTNPSSLSTGSSTTSSPNDSLPPPSGGSNSGGEIDSGGGSGGSSSGGSGGGGSTDSSSSSGGGSGGSSSSSSGSSSGSSSNSDSGSHQRH